MKTLSFILIGMLFGCATAFSAPITVESAQDVAQNFYSQNSKQVIKTTTLTYTELSATGKAVYYVFSINQEDGYVIVPADDSQPIMGYALQGTYVSPKTKTTACNSAVTIDRWSASAWATGPKKG